MKESLLSEFDMEMANTRRTLERIPDEKFDWKPHPKSGTLGWMAGHLANLPYWTVVTLTWDSLDLAPAGAPVWTPPKPANRKEVLDFFDKHKAEARTVLASTPEADYAKPWALLMGGKELFRHPRAEVLRRMVLNHSIHHRGQLTMYLRLLDVPVPALYGPSADEQAF
ncbi:MAG TPA: DinB family protein [Terriglobales bacterium]|nr:DinB family protein [Terriglobales bacterium]